MFICFWMASAEARQAAQFYGKDTRDEKVTAWGYLKQAAPGHAKEIRITIVNDSAKSINVKPTFASFTLITQSNEEIELLMPAMLWYPATDSIKPKTKAIFIPSFGALRVQKEDIKEIICSFDLDGTKIILRPKPYEPPAARKEKPRKEASRVSDSSSVSSSERPSDGRWTGGNFALSKEDRRKREEVSRVSSYERPHEEVPTASEPYKAMAKPEEKPHKEASRVSDSSSVSNGERPFEGRWAGGDFALAKKDRREKFVS